MATKHVEIVRAEGKQGVRDASLRARERTHKNAQAEITRHGWLEVDNL
jgi:hypothetical protein